MPWAYFRNKRISSLALILSVFQFGMTMYLHGLVSNDIETQKKGLVFIIYHHGASKPNVNFQSVMKKANEFENAGEPLSFDF